MKTLIELQPLIIEWAKERNLLFAENAPKQKLKLIEECGELASAILKNDVKLKKDAIGDIFVVLVILAKQLDIKLLIDLSENDSILNEDISYLIGSICYQNDLLSDVEVLILDDISKLLNLDITECANIAWNEIKNRKGKTVNGTFIKNKNIMKKTIITFSIINIILYLMITFIVWDFFWFAKLSEWETADRFLSLLLVFLLNLFCYIFYKIIEN